MKLTPSTFLSLCVILLAQRPAAAQVKAVVPRTLLAPTLALSAAPTASSVLSPTAAALAPTLAASVVAAAGVVPAQVSALIPAAGQARFAAQDRLIAADRAIAAPNAVPEAHLTALYDFAQARPAAAVTVLDETPSGNRASNLFKAPAPITTSHEKPAYHSADPAVQEKHAKFIRRYYLARRIDEGRNLSDLLNLLRDVSPNGTTNELKDEDGKPVYAGFSYSGKQGDKPELGDFAHISFGDLTTYLAPIFMGNSGFKKEVKFNIALSENGIQSTQFVRSHLKNDRLTVVLKGAYGAQFTKITIEFHPDYAVRSMTISNGNFLMMEKYWKTLSVQFVDTMDIETWTHMSDEPGISKYRP